MLVGQVVLNTQESSEPFGIFFVLSLLLFQKLTFLKHVILEKKKEEASFFFQKYNFLKYIFEK